MIDNINEMIPGMVVKLRGGAMWVVMMNDMGELLLRDIHNASRITFLSAYDNLTFSHTVFNDYDIMQVFEAPIYCDNYEICERPHLVSPIAWERPKDEKKDNQERINEIFQEIGRLWGEYEELRG